MAQIAYSGAPIINANGVIESPENSDKLAQRNLQVSTSGNPGFPATHRVPQTIDARPSPPAQSSDPTSILSYPDEMMIDWGRTPPGSVASLYWPAVSASSDAVWARPSIKSCSMAARAGSPIRAATSERALMVIMLGI